MSDLTTIQLQGQQLEIFTQGNPRRIIQCAPPAATQIAWNGAAPLTLEVLPVGHVAGVYEVCCPINVRTSALATAQRQWSFNAPTSGAALAENTDVINSLAAAALVSTDPMTIVSDGSAAISVILTPNGDPTGLVADVFASAALQATL